jgi:hypothetical protein
MERKSRTKNKKTKHRKNTTACTKPSETHGTKNTHEEQKNKTQEEHHSVHENKRHTRNENHARRTLKKTKLRKNTAATEVAHWYKAWLIQQLACYGCTQ